MTIIEAFNPLPVFIHTVLLELSHTHLFLLCPWLLWGYNGRSELLWQRWFPPSHRCLKYSLIYLQTPALLGQFRTAWSLGEKPLRTWFNQPKNLMEHRPSNLPVLMELTSCREDRWHTRNKPHDMEERRSAGISKTLKQGPVPTWRVGEGFATSAFKMRPWKQGKLAKETGEEEFQAHAKARTWETIHKDPRVSSESEGQWMEQLWTMWLPHSSGDQNP